MKIAMGSDHGGIHLKNHLKDYLELKGYEVIDKGTYTEESCGKRGKRNASLTKAPRLAFGHTCMRHRAWYFHSGQQN